MSNVVPLCHEEGVRVDPARLFALVEELDEAAAEGVIGQTMREMALRLAFMEQQYLHGDAAVSCRDARRLARLAAGVGMTTFACVAADVQRCAARGDMVAFAATWSRLTRIGDRSLSEVWDIATAEAPG